MFHIFDPWSLMVPTCSGAVLTHTLRLSTTEGGANSFSFLPICPATVWEANQQRFFCNVEIWSGLAVRAERLSLPTSSGEEDSEEAAEKTSPLEPSSVLLFHCTSLSSWCLLSGGQWCSGVCVCLNRHIVVYLHRFHHQTSESDSTNHITASFLWVQI